MARALWSGAISFGLIFIPVSLNSADSPGELELDLLDKRDFARVGYRRINKVSGKEVTWANIIKGYEYESGKYVALGNEDFKQANVKATQTIDLLAFVEQSEIEPIYFDKPYYLTAGKRGEKVYALLREALKKSGKVGVAQIVIRVKQHLAVIAAVGDALVLNTLRYPEEIKEVGDLGLPQTAVKAGLSRKEVDMAVALIEGMSEEWRPAQYHDQYRADLLKLINRKIKARQTHMLNVQPDDEVADAASNTADVIDLMALLKKSLPGAGGADVMAKTTSTRSRSAKAKSVIPGAHKPATRDKSVPSTAKPVTGKTPSSKDTGVTSVTKRRKSA